MAAVYTSTQAGNWNAVATWGGGGWPNAAGDIVNVGHDVAYNVNDVATALGNVTLNSGGILNFATNQDTGFLLGDSAAIDFNGGELRIGTKAAVLDKAYTAKIHFVQGVASRTVITQSVDAIVSVYADPDLYGSQMYAALKNNWSAGQTFYVAGDVSSKWISGQLLYVHKYAVYASIETDGITLTIDTVGSYDSGNDRTPITITDAAPGVTFNAGGQVINLARNIEFIDPGSSTAVYGWDSYAEHIGMTIGSDTSSGIVFSDVLFRGWRRAHGYSFRIIGRNLVYLNNDYCILEGGSNDINAVWVSNNFVSARFSLLQGDTGEKYSGKMCSNSICIRRRNALLEECDFIANSAVFSAGWTARMIGSCISNNILFSAVGGNCLLVSSLFELNTSVASTVAGLTPKYVVFDTCNIDGTQIDLEIRQNTGDFSPLISGDGDWETPPSGNDYILKAISNNFCGEGFTFRMALEPKYNSALAVYFEAGPKTLTMKIWPVGFSASLDQDDIYLTATYLNTVSGTSRTTVVTGTGTFANGAWRNLTVDVVPAQAGLVYFNLIMTKYEAGDYVLIDPVWSVA